MLVSALLVFGVVVFGWLVFPDCLVAVFVLEVFAVLLIVFEKAPVPSEYSIGVLYFPTPGYCLSCPFHGVALGDSLAN